MIYTVKIHATPYRVNGCRDCNCEPGIIPEKIFTKDGMKRMWVSMCPDCEKRVYADSAIACVIKWNEAHPENKALQK